MRNSFVDWPYCTVTRRARILQREGKGPARLFVDTEGYPNQTASISINKTLKQWLKSNLGFCVFIQLQRLTCRKTSRKVLRYLSGYWTWPPSYAELPRVATVSRTCTPPSRTSWSSLIQIIDLKWALSTNNLSLRTGIFRSSSSSYSAWIHKVEMVRGTTTRYAYVYLGFFQLPFGVWGLVIMTSVALQVEIVLLRTFFKFIDSPTL